MLTFVKCPRADPDSLLPRTTRLTLGRLQPVRAVTAQEVLEAAVPGLGRCAEGALLADPGHATELLLVGTCERRLSYRLASMVNNRCLQASKEAARLRKQVGETQEEAACERATIMQLPGTG